MRVLFLQLKKQLALVLNLKDMLFISLPSATSPLSEGVKVATYDKVNLVQNILDPSIDPITGLVVDAAKQTGTDAGVQRYF